MDNQIGIWNHPQMYKMDLVGRTQRNGSEASDPPTDQDARRVGPSPAHLPIQTHVLSTCNCISPRTRMCLFHTDCMTLSDEINGYLSVIGLVRGFRKRSLGWATQVCHSNHSRRETGNSHPPFSLPYIHGSCVFSYPCEMDSTLAAAEIEASSLCCSKSISRNIV